MRIKTFLTRPDFILSTKGRTSFFVFALLINLFWLYTAKLTNKPEGKDLFVLGVEIKQDLVAAENFFHTGNYYFGKNNMDEDDFTYRLPGFLFVYLPFRCLLSTDAALTAIVLLQVLLSTLATLALARIVFNITKKPIYYYVAFMLFLGSGYVQNHNFGLNREGLTTYVLIFALYLLQSWYAKPKLYLMILFSLLLTWCYLYRAFLVPPVFIIFAIILYYQWEGNKKLPMKLAFLLFLPSIIFFSYWIPRNYVLTKKLIPLETCTQHKELFMSEIRLIQTWGGEALPWIENSEGSWFNKSFNGKLVSDKIMPHFLFNDTLTLDTLKKVRTFCLLAGDSSLPFSVRQYNAKKALGILNKFTKLQHEKFPVRSYVIANFYYLFNFLNQPIGLRTRNIVYPLNVICTFTTSFINYFVFFVGFLASVFLLFKKKLFKDIFFSQIIIFCLLVFFIGFFILELRRIAHLFPFLLINALLVMHLLFEKNRKLGWAILGVIILLLSVLSVYSCINNIAW